MAEWRKSSLDACLQPETGINRKLNRKLNCNGTGTKLQWPNNNYYMYASSLDAETVHIGSSRAISDGPSLRKYCVAVKSLESSRTDENNRKSN